MANIPFAGPSAVAIIETPDYFIAEGRPDMPRQLAHAGRIQLFGGHAEEAPEATICRELSEELNLQLSSPPKQVWHGEVLSQNRQGEPVRRNVSLFRLVLASEAELTLQIPGKIERIPKTTEGVDSYRNRLTPFAFSALRRALACHPDETWEMDAIADNMGK